MSERRFRRTPGGVVWLGLHVLWCPKSRRRVRGGRVAVSCGEVVGQVAGERGREIVATEVIPDRGHVFVGVGPTDAAGSVVQAFKGRASRVLGAEFPDLRRLTKVLWSPWSPWCDIGHRWDAVAW
jgi:putative transposase